MTDGDTMVTDLRDLCLRLMQFKAKHDLNFKPAIVLEFEDVSNRCRFQFALQAGAGALHYDDFYPPRDGEISMVGVTVMLKPDVKRAELQNRVYREEGENPRYGGE